MTFLPPCYIYLHIILYFCPTTYLRFKKVYPPNYQLDIWDNPDCFLVLAEIGKQLYVYVSDRYFNVTDFLENIEQQYTRLQI